MKKVILGLLLACSAMSASAQFEAGKKYINLSTTSLGLSYSKSEKLRFDIGATAGLFVTRDLLLYGTAEYNHKQLMYTKFGGRPVNTNMRTYQDEVQIGVGARYYIEQNGIYLGLGVQYGHAEQNIDNLYITPEVGYAFFINQYLTIEPAVYYHMSVNDFSDGSKVGLKLGVGFYF